MRRAAILGERVWCNSPFLRNPGSGNLTVAAEIE